MNFKILSAACVALAVSASGAFTQTLAAVQSRGTLNCGVSDGIVGFSSADANGKWQGFDADFCRALAAAIFNDPEKVTFVSLSTDERFPALQNKRIDVLSRNTTWTMGRETGLGIIFAGTSYYDGQGFMVRRTPRIESALELADKTICTQSGTTTELNLADYFRNNKLSYTAATFPSAEEALKAYESGRCVALTSDQSQLHAQRTRLSAPQDHVILPEVISKEPLSPAVRQDDIQWINIVKWTLNAMITGEELGVSSKTIDEASKSQKADVRRLLGLEGRYGEQLGLTNDWASRVIRHVGNYAEVFERNVGVNTKLAIPRGINSLWDRGGLLYAPPIR